MVYRSYFRACIGIDAYWWMCFALAWTYAVNLVFGLVWHLDLELVLMLQLGWNRDLNADINVNWNHDRVSILYDDKAERWYLGPSSPWFMSVLRYRRGCRMSLFMRCRKCCCNSMLYSSDLAREKKIERAREWSRGKKISKCPAQLRKKMKKVF